jgi:hypothetical protein
VWSYTSTPPYVFMVWCVAKYRENFTLTLPKESTCAVSGQMVDLHPIGCFHSKTGLLCSVEYEITSAAEGFMMRS